MKSLIVSIVAATSLVVTGPVAEASGTADANRSDGFPARLVSPASESTATNARPTFRWTLPAGMTDARVELCADRTCARVTASFVAHGSAGRPEADLPAGRYFWRVVASRADSVVAPASIAWPVAVRSRRDAVDTAFGVSFDLDGDGAMDRVHAVDLDGEIGTAVVDRGAGRTHITIRSDAAGPSFGDAASAAGDIDGDGFGDIVIGAPSFANDTGRVDVYFGTASGLSSRVQTLTAPASGGRFGWAVAAAGDVDRDGFGDVVIGAYQHDGGAGRAYLYRGSATGLVAAPATVLVAPEANENFGISVSTAGDIDGDGFADVIVGADFARNRAGRAYVYRGGAAGLSNTPATVLEGIAAREDFGISVAGGFDFDGDGFGDVAVGAHAHPGGGRVQVFLGGREGIASEQSLVFDAAQGEHDFGLTLAIVADDNGDGLDDLAIGSISGPGWHESTRVISGVPHTRLARR